MILFGHMKKKLYKYCQILTLYDLKGGGGASPYNS